MHGPSDMGPSHVGLLVDPAGTGTRLQVARDIWLRPQDLRRGPESPGTAAGQCGPSTQARVTRECWWTPRALGHQRESPGSAGRPRRTWDTGPSRPTHLVNTAVPRTWGPSHLVVLIHPVGPRNCPESPGIARQPRGPWDRSASHPGELVDIVGPRTRARFARERWSTSRDLTRWPESPRAAG